MKTGIKIVGQIVEKIVDQETGEILSEVVENKAILGKQKEEYTIVYNSMFQKFAELSGTAIKVICILVSNNRPSQPVIINKFVKERIAKEINSKSVGSVSNSLKELVNSKLLLKDPNSKSVYYVNPLYVYKGSTFQRKSVIANMIQQGFELE